MLRPQRTGSIPCAPVPYRSPLTHAACETVRLSPQPNKALKKKTLTKTFTRVAKSIIKNTETNFYRPDLTKAALAKWSLIHRAQLKDKKAKA